MIEELSGIIDSLYRDAASGKRNKKKLVFLLGAGFWPVNNILSDEKLLKKYSEDIKPTVPITTDSKEFQDYKWRHFEAARYYSYYHQPSFAHYCIYALARDGLCRDVITTNYDLFLDSLWDKKPDLPVSINPVCDLGEYLWERYYSQKTNDDDKIRYWKVHGSLSHIIFRGKASDPSCVIFRLPCFPISGNHPDLAEAFPDLCFIPPLLYESFQYPGTNFVDCKTLGKRFEPFIDWTLQENRNPFIREIHAVEGLLRREEYVAAIILIGFAGYHNPSHDSHNEELAPVILDIVNTNTIPVFMAVQIAQWDGSDEKPERFALIHELRRRNRCERYDIVDKFFIDFLSPPSSRYFKYDPIRNEYLDLLRFYLKETEPKYGYRS